jgi:hypothetical protein
MLAAAATFSAGCDDDPTAPGHITEQFDWRGSVAVGDRIEIKSLAGDVRASFTTGDEVVVRAIKSGRDSDPASVAIEVVRHAEGVTICAVYPDVPGLEPNECLPGFAGDMSNHDNDVEVEFVVEVPAGVEFVGRVVYGDVEAVGLRSDVFVLTTGGDVTVATTGIAAVTAASGSIDVTIGQADPGRDLAFRTAAGDVNVRVPANTNADVWASTSSGSISSDFPLDGTARTRSGTLGDGGPNLWLSTVNGNVGLSAGPDAQP